MDKNNDKDKVKKKPMNNYYFKQESYYDSDETTDWDENKVDSNNMIAMNNSGEPYIK